MLIAATDPTPFLLSMLASEAPRVPWIVKEQPPERLRLLLEDIFTEKE
jgi:hypothetical protein